MKLTILACLILATQVRLARSLVIDFAVTSLLGLGTSYSTRREKLRCPFVGSGGKPRRRESHLRRHNSGSPRTTCQAEPKMERGLQFPTVRSSNLCQPG